MTNTNITPEVIAALRVLRSATHLHEGLGDAINTLDNAGVFAAIDEATGYDVDPEPEPVSECTCMAVRWGYKNHHNEGCPEAPVSKCTCPQGGFTRPTGTHRVGCPGDPAEWGDMAFTTAPTAADNIRRAVGFKF